MSPGFDLFRRAPTLVDQIRKRTRPPGLSVPHSLLLRADEVIQ
jgi:hypothetical protein